MRRTKKRVQAERTAVNLKLKLDFNDENLYQVLQENNFFWDSKSKTWYEGEEPDPPTNLIKLRIWSREDMHKSDKHRIMKALEDVGFKLEEMSKPYKCRPPKQLELRTYLSLNRIYND